MNVHIDDQLLEAVTRKTGNSRETLLGQIEAIVQAHLNQLLGETPSPETKGVDMEHFIASAQKLATKHGAAFRELAK